MPDYEEKASLGSKEPAIMELAIQHIQANFNNLSDIDYTLRDNIIARLDAIANRLNSNAYPKNSPKSVSGDMTQNKPDVPKQPAQGYVENLHEVNQRTTDAIEMMYNKTISNIIDAITFIEKHI